MHPDNPACNAHLKVKASVGATGTMMWLDTKTNRCHVVRLGKAVPFATASKGMTAAGPYLPCLTHRIQQQLMCWHHAHPGLGCIITNQQYKSRKRPNCSAPNVAPCSQAHSTQLLWR